MAIIQYFVTLEFVKLRLQGASQLVIGRIRIQVPVGEPHLDVKRKLARLRGGKRRTHQRNLLVENSVGQFLLEEIEMFAHLARNLARRQ